MKYRFAISWAVAGMWVAGLATAAEDVQKIAAEVASKDKTVCLRAIDQLASLGERATPAVAALVEALARPEAEVRWHAARALGSLGTAAQPAAPALIARLDDEQIEVRSYAAYALGKLGVGSNEVVDRLIQLAFDRNALVRRAALRALEQLNPPKEKVMPLALRILEEGDPAVIVPALQTLAEQGEAVVPRLCEALQHERACYWACVVLADIGPKAAAAVPSLKQVLKHSDPEVRMQALMTLGEIGPAAKPLLPEIAGALQHDETAGVRYAAAFALGRIGASPESRAALEGTLKQDDAFLRMVCAWALARNDPQDKVAVQRAVNLILAAFKSEDQHLRRAAAKAAVDFDMPLDQIAPLLIAALRDKDPKVVGNAIEALAELGPKALKHVSEALANKQLRPYAVRLIQRLGPKAETVVPALIAALQQSAAGEDEVLFRREVQFALGAIGPAAQAAVPDLVTSLSSDEETLAASAGLALGKIGPAARAAVPTLRQKANHPSPIVRLVCLRALLQIQPGERQLVAIAVPQLLKALDSDQEMVRAEAAATLGELKEFRERIIPRLKGLLKDESPLVRDQAAEALKRLDG